MCMCPVWGDRVKCLAADPVIMRSSPATRHVHCRLNNPNKLNLLSWLLVYLSDKHSAWYQTF